MGIKEEDTERERGLSEPMSDAEKKRRFKAWYEKIRLKPQEYLFKRI